MKWEEAKKQINDNLGVNPKPELTEKGFMVRFDMHVGGLYYGHYFPDKHLGEELISTEEQAWHVAKLFAAATDESYGDIYVIKGEDFTPVKDYAKRKLKSFR